MADKSYNYKCKKCKERFETSEIELKKHQIPIVRGFGKNPWAAGHQAQIHCPHCGHKNKVSF